MKANDITAQKEVRSHQPAPPQEEAQVNYSLTTASGEFGIGDGTDARDTRTWSLWHTTLSSA